MGRAGWRVSALKYATRPTTRSDIFYRYELYGEPDAPTEMAYYVWVLRSDTMTILVDTGFSHLGAQKRGRSHSVPPLQALRRIGVQPGAVDLLVVTHLHYDHTGHLDAFADVPMVLPRTEVDVWSSPVARRAQFAIHIEPAEVDVAVQRVRAGRAELLEGRAEIAPGVLALEVGGHSPGQTILRVETEQGPVILASDAVHYYEELDSDRACGVHVDLAKVYGAYDMIRELLQEDGARLVPGHDPLVMERFARLEGDAGSFGVSI